MRSIDLVLEQAEDEGLWFITQSASEAYLQQELRKLHALIEKEWECPECLGHGGTRTWTLPRLKIECAACKGTGLKERV